ncbi:flavodoxin-dependent (E)-4-hydroxy-3-methylbut-2-enyl-diphosphate synthase [Treponema sp. Marseille-Q3903]|uniref:flavodoxin-dependent (E)-4-hydroxy-3-methylbut-2-enyl-diphosphate synthase n=1 Tax=Treponema sp. Marseille-Q3903 TaxID=2766703 RepID=UPI0016526135|nr:flavodoxin-dependent (E)-4-hydroxy-3-methylbut-2-enyl-diphosphate synthase [Treponema sp. Marseille-Q3903]MBC6713678.1 flavodoxin-dependent (E)-4-hydroxy-3-methylbut-2-enyl-diphosphate synthase [Treponema sp. Marseille-Q3903]
MSIKIFLGGKGITNRISIGGDSPISLQTMWKEPINDISSDTQKLDSTLKQINDLQLLGCDIIRFAVPDIESAKSLSIIAERTSMPLVADIHFDYRLAIECLKGNVAAIRINPGNIGSFENTKKVVEACRENGVAIRIGINSGSLPKDLQEQIALGNMSRSQGLCETAVREAEVFDKLNFNQYVVSMKSSDVTETVECNEFYAEKYNNPLHLGVTEAGPLIGGIVKSTMAFQTLLNQGIGDTIRVSLSSSPENEVIAGLNILKECGKRKGGVKIISCPRCGRIGFDVHSFINRWQNKLLCMNKDISVAVMGCVVNGPGEGKHADIGIAGGNGKAIIFKKGKIVRTIDEKDADKVFEEELKSF